MLKYHKQLCLSCEIASCQSFYTAYFIRRPTTPSPRFHRRSKSERKPWRFKADDDKVLWLFGLELVRLQEMVSHQAMGMTSARAGCLVAEPVLAGAKFGSGGRVGVALWMRCCGEDNLFSVHLLLVFSEPLRMQTGRPRLARPFMTTHKVCSTGF